MNLHDSYELFLLFIIRVKRELKRVYINGCRYNGTWSDDQETKVPESGDREDHGRGEGAVCMSERVVQGRGGCRLVRTISAVIYT
jgi:hypothetical protein